MYGRHRLLENCTCQFIHCVSGTLTGQKKQRKMDGTDKWNNKSEKRKHNLALSFWEDKIICVLCKRVANFCTSFKSDSGDLLYGTSDNVI